MIALVALSVLRTTRLLTFRSGADGTRGRLELAPGVNGAELLTGQDETNAASAKDGDSLDRVSGHSDPQVRRQSLAFLQLDLEPTDDLQKILAVLTAWAESTSTTRCAEQSRKLCMNVREEKDETLRQYVQRRKQQFDHATRHAVGPPTTDHMAECHFKMW